MSILDTINEPGDIKKVDPADYKELAREIRSFLVRVCTHCSRAWIFARKNYFFCRQKNLHSPLDEHNAVMIQFTQPLSEEGEVLRR